MEMAPASLLDAVVTEDTAVESDEPITEEPFSKR